jgi:fluoride exporter
MERLFWVCAGGAVGSGARYLVSLWMFERWGSALPWGTLAVNLVGSFLLGFAMQASVVHTEFPPVARLALTAGVLGGFTTYSSFNHETLSYLERGESSHAGLYVVLTLAGCLGAGLAGQWAARFVSG